MRFLLVEDADTAASLEAAALRAGFGPDTVVDRVSKVSAALEALSSAAYGAAVVDLNVDDSLGLATVERIRGAAPALPLVVVSSETDDILKGEALKAGARAFLVKGAFQPSDLAAAVRAALR